MLNWVWSSFGLVFGGLIAWVWTKAILKMQYTYRLRALDSKLRSKDAEAGELKVRLGKLEQEVGLLNKVLQDEREIKNREISELGLSFKRGFAVMSVFFLSAGIFLGSAGGWKAGSSEQRGKNVEENALLKLDLQKYRLKSALYGKQVKDLESDVRVLNLSLTQEKVSRAVSETKLEILLSSLDDRRGHEGMVIVLTR